MQQKRLKRLEKELQRLISKVINFKLRDKYLDFVTVTNVTLSADLSVARIYYTHLDNAPDDKIHQALTKSSGVIKNEIASAKMMRKIPELFFHYDEVEKTAREIDQILEKIKSERDDDTEEQ
jgi:ribosome-binding factor A